MDAPRYYDDFPIVLRRRTKHRLEVSLPAADDVDPVDVAFTDGELDADLLKLDRGPTSLPQSDVVRLGQRLTDLLLPEGPIRDHFDAAIARAEQKQTGVRLRLSIRDASTAVLPWELCYFQRHQGEVSGRHFLALDPLVSIVRRPQLVGAQPSQPQPSAELLETSRLRFVGCTANAGAYVELNLDRERDAIRNAFSKFAIPGVEFQETFVDDATYEQLSSALDKGADLFHFAGHGVFEQREVDRATSRPIREGSIVLRGENGAASLLGAGSLALLLRGKGVRVAFLGACDAGRQDGVSAWTGVAPALIEKGIAAVVAMQFKIADHIATRFSAAFYREIVRGVTVDEAVAAARLEVFQLDESGWQWAVPVLYTRAEQGVIFPVSSSPVPLKEAGPAAPLPTRIQGRRQFAFLKDLFDRKVESEELGVKLADPGTRIISVVGRGGMGKTAVVSVVMAGLEQNRWPDPATRIRVDGIAYFSARETAFTIDKLFSDCARLMPDEQATQLDLIWANTARPPEERFDKLLQALATGYRVIVLDDVETLLTDDGAFIADRVGSFVDAVLNSSASVNLVLVSRVAPAFDPRVIGVVGQVEIDEGLPTDDAIAMLRAKARAEDLGSGPEAESSIRDAVIKLGGAPRALELIASILGQSPLGGLAEVLRGFFTDKVVIRDLIDEVYAKLDENDRRVIEALATYRGPVPMDAIRAILEPVAPNLDVNASIVRLVRGYLVITNRAAGTAAVGAIDQAYAYDHLPVTGPMSRKEVETRAADYFKGKRLPPKGWQRIGDLDPQVREFEHRLRADDPDGASAALEGIDVHMAWYGSAELLRELRKRLEGRVTTPRQKAVQAFGLGHVAVVIGPLADALTYFEETLARAREAGDEHLEALALQWIAETNRRLGQLELADQQFPEAIKRIAALNNPEELASVSLAAGLTAAYVGDGRRAIEYGKQLLAMAGDVTRTVGRAHDCMSLGYLVLGQLEEADAQAVLGIAAYKTSDAREPMPYVENVRGMVCSERGQLDAALEYFERAEAQGVDVEQPRIRGLGQFNRARTYRKLSQPTKALTVATDAEASLGQAGASEARAATALREALEAAARSDLQAELAALLTCIRTSLISADIQPAHDLAREVESRAREAGSTDVAAEASGLVKQLAARLAEGVPSKAESK